MGRINSNYISDDEYLGIFGKAQAVTEAHNSLPDEKRAYENAQKILDGRTKNGLTIAESSFLINNASIHQSVFSLVKTYSSKLRSQLFGAHVAVMAPLEYGSSCMSNCLFCGWRATNSEMPRLKLSEEGIKLEAEHLARLGFSHLELSGGDNLVFLKESLGRYLRILKDSASKIMPEVRSSICLTPLHLKQYSKLKNESGLDVVLTWQETYDRNMFEKYIVSGPKRFGIDEDFNLEKSDRGFLNRLRSQEMAIAAGLQVGIGTMIGLHPSLNADIIACLIHGQRLIQRFDGQTLPMIFGMPIWRPITTNSTDLREERIKDLNIDEHFVLASAIYLLGMPDYYSWVFPNCRVPIEVQIESMKVAGCFSSTEVSVAPGGYSIKGANSHNEYMVKQGKHFTDDMDLIKKGEQFSHFFASHKSYLHRFDLENFKITTDFNLLKFGHA